MSPSRRLEFEAELDNNPELKTEYLIYKAIHSDIRTMSQISDVISDPNIEDAFKLADEAIAEYQQNTRSADFTSPSDPTPQELNEPIELYSKTKVRRIYYFLSSAAAIILLALVFKFFVFETDSSKLFEKYYSPAEMALNNTRGGDQGQNASLNIAYKFYSMGEMTKAHLALKSSLLTNEASPLSLYLNGLIEIEDNNFRLAIESLTKNLTTSDAFYLEKHWYAALCYLGFAEKVSSAN